MSFIGNAVGSIVGGITGAKQQAKAAEAASEIQGQAADTAIQEQRRQFDMLTELLRPYVEAGTPALQRQQALLGLRGAPEQQAAIGALEQSPLFQSAVRQGEEALLQQASATGGLRGGNIQAALAQFRPAMLQEQIAQQFERLGGLTSLGQASATGQGAAGMGMAGSIGNLLAQRGQALAGGKLAIGSVPRQAFGDLLTIASMFGGAGRAGRAGGADGAGGGNLGSGLKMPAGF
jgi:hypothetical protein